MNTMLDTLPNKYRHGINPTAMCGRYYRHSECSGFHKMKYGTRSVCTCSCHKDKKSKED